MQPDFINVLVDMLYCVVGKQLHPISDEMFIRFVTVYNFRDKVRYRYQRQPSLEWCPLSIQDILRMPTPEIRPTLK